MKEIFKFYIKYTKPLHKKIIVYGLLYVVFSAITIVCPLYEGKLIDAISSMNVSAFVCVIGIYGSLSILSIILSLIMNKLNVYISNGTINQIIKKTIQHLFCVSYKNLNTKDPTMITQELIQDSREIHDFLMQKSLLFISNVGLYIFALYIILKQSIFLSGFICVVLACYIMSYFHFKNKIYITSKNLKESQSIYYSYFYKIMNFVKDIRLNALTQKTWNIQNEYYNSMLKSSLFNQKTLNKQELYGSMINFVAQIFIFGYGFKLVMERQISLGYIVTISNYFSSMLGYSQSFISYFSSYQTALFSYERLKKLIEIKQIANGKYKIQSIERICIENLTFSFDSHLIISHKNMKFEKGNIYCIKGINGAGKSTFINCLFGIFGYDYQGDIFFNDIDVKEVDMLDNIEHNFSISQQAPYLFEGTIEENICLGKTMDYEWLKELLDGFGLTKTFNEKVETLNGYKDSLSGGEKQKISLIRTILSDKSVLVFDEPFTYLDNSSRKYFAQIIQKIHGNKIVLIVSHEDVGLASKEIVM